MKTASPREQMEFVAALRRGNLLDAFILWYGLDPQRYWQFRPTQEEHSQVIRLNKAYHADQFCSQLHLTTAKQVEFYKQAMQLNYMGVAFSLDVKCMFDYFQHGINNPYLASLSSPGYGGDLKRTSARNEAEFMKHIDFFEYDRARAWYMDVASLHGPRVDQDFIVGVNESGKIFKVFINRGDEMYQRGRERYTYWAFKKWILG
jgi:hypothetical protein